MFVEKIDSLFLAFFVGIYAVEPYNSTKKIQHFSNFFVQKTRARI